MGKLAPDVLARVKLSASTTTLFQFFDQVFLISSDTQEMVRSFREIFARFCLPDKSKAPGLNYYILSKKNCVNRPLLIVDDRIFFLDNERDLTGFAYMKIMDSVLSKIESHTLLHGAALSYKGQGVIFPAASKSGKSTTALELVKRGFSFLSDDIAALSRDDHTLYPFPKKVGLLPDTIKLHPEIDNKRLLDFPMLGGGERRKRLLDIEELFIGSMGKPCKPRYLIFLGPLPEKRKPTDNTRRLFVVLSHLTKNILKEIQQKRGVSDASIFPGHQKFPVLKLEWKQPFPGLSGIEDICYDHDILIFDHSDGRESTHNFNDTPELKRISRSQAMFQLLKEIKGGQKAAIFQKECKGSAASLLITLGEMFNKVDCYYLTPGRLKERVDLVCNLCGLELKQVELPRSKV